MRHRFWLLVIPLLLAAHVSPGGRVLRPFELPEHNWLPGHRGVDLELAVGAPVVASDAGTVAFAGTVAGRPSVSIVHADGVRTTYTPVFARVRAGDAVAAGEVIGTLAPGGEPGLHWGALTGPDEYIDPLSLLGTPEIRLKPLDS